MLQPGVIVCPNPKTASPIHIIFYFLNSTYTNNFHLFYLTTGEKAGYEQEKSRMACNICPWLTLCDVKFRRYLFPLAMTAQVSLKGCFSTYVYLNLDWFVQGHPSLLLICNRSSQSNFSHDCSHFASN